MFKDFSLLIKVTYKIKLEPMNTIHTWIVPFLGERLFKPKKKMIIQYLLKAIMYLVYWNSHFVDQSLVKNFDIEVYNFPLINHVYPITCTIGDSRKYLEPTKGSIFV